jgi:hypothetical protein
MKANDVILRLDATYHPTVAVGDRIKRGEPVCNDPVAADVPTAPVAGIVEDVQFDPGPHEFVITIRPA